MLFEFTENELGNYYSKPIVRDEKKEDLKEKNKFNDIMVINNYIKGNKLFSQIKLEKCIGFGSHGFIYSGKILNKRIAIKFIPEKKFNEQKEENQEIKIHNKLKHKNISAMLGYIKIKELHCLILEYGIYGDLFDFREKFIKKKNLSETFLCFATGQILSALKYLYDCNIVHMDIKPQNIIVDGNLEIKLIDFSISSDISKIEHNSKLQAKGTTCYMSPEVIKCHTIALVNYHKIDLYSLGVILFEAAYDDMPYGITSTDQYNYNSMYNKIKRNELLFPKNNNNFSFLFKDFLKGLLDKNIKNRFDIYKSINHPWIKEGYNIIKNEKEKIYDHQCFIINLISDNIYDFNYFIMNQNNIIKSFP